MASLAPLSYNKPTITDAAASVLLLAAEQCARELGIRMTVAVVDESGILKAFRRMDDAPLMSVSAAVKKAVTAVGFGMKTGDEWYSFIKDDPILLHGALSLDQFTLLGGGIPVFVEQVLVGAIGVSGGHYARDMECAQAAIDALLKV
jgi:uncharacterized protein GlcG (DUF336 family)